MLVEAVEVLVALAHHKAAAAELLRCSLTDALLPDLCCFLDPGVCRAAGRCYAALAATSRVSARA
jgi:hypothetical protein